MVELNMVSSMISKVKNFLKKYKVEILSFIIPMVIFLAACAFSGVVPFGEKYIVSYDGSAQYPGFTNILINALKGKNSLFYTFKGGLGYNFYATAIYYLFNPTNLLSVFFNNTNIMYFYELIIFLRIGLCGLTMSIYLRSYKKFNNSRLLFSIAYALMAYNVVYFYNFMYFDTVVLLPLVILGLDKILEGKSSKLYIIFLSLSIISNYYIGSMVCIFCLLYFIYRYILLNKDKRKGIIKTFIISSLLSGIICSFVLIPEFLELMRGKVDLYQDEYTVYNEWHMDFLTSFYRLTVASYSNGDQINGSPNIYSSVLVLVYVLLFFFNKKFSKKERIATLIFICFFLLCFSFNFLDYAWQFFQRPCWYPNRYSFVFSFLLIVIGYKSFNTSDNIDLSNNKLIIITTLLFLLIIGGSIVDKIYKHEASKYIFLTLSLICVIEYTFTYKIKVLPFLITAIFLFEVSANTLLSVKQISFPKKVGVYDQTFENIKDSFDYIEQIDPIKNNFYRADSQNWVNLNNGGFFNYNGLVFFDSLRNRNIMQFLEYYGDYIVVDECSTRFNAVNPVLTSLFGFKYIVSGNVENYYQNINNELDMMVYRNNEYLSLGFMVNSAFKDIELSKKLPFENSNEIVNKSLNKEIELIKKIKYTSITTYEEDDDYIYYNREKGGYVSYLGVADKDYFIFRNPIKDDATSNSLVINDGREIYYAGFTPITLKKGDKYEMKFITNARKTNKSRLYIYLMDIDSYKSWIGEMRKNELEIITYKKDDYIKGKISVTEDKTTLFTSIPYDEGWSIYVDGKKVKYEKLLSAFIGLDLETGEHIIEFKYLPKGLILGSIISFISLIGTIFYLKKTKTTIK